MRLDLRAMLETREVKVREDSKVSLVSMERRESLGCLDCLAGPECPPRERKACQVCQGSKADLDRQEYRVSEERTVSPDWLARLE